MRTIGAIAGRRDECGKLPLARIARAGAAAHGLIARFPRRISGHRRAACLAAVGAAFALTAAAAPADSAKIGGTGAGLGSMKLMVQEFNKSRPDARLIVAQSMGSAGAIKGVLAGAVEIGISARPLTAEENSQGASARAYARTPLVIATGTKNGGADLTLSQLARIYSGKVSHWSDGTPIRLVLRPPGDADTVALKAFSAEMSAAVNAGLARKGLRVADTDQENADALEQLPGALGATTLTQIVSENRALRPLALDGVMPSLAALAAGRYRYSRTLYLVTGRNPSPLTRDFAAFVRSPAGQAVLARSGNLALKD